MLWLNMDRQQSPTQVLSHSLSSAGQRMGRKGEKREKEVQKKQNKSVCRFGIGAL